MRDVVVRAGVRAFAMLVLAASSYAQQTIAVVPPASPALALRTSTLAIQAFPMITVPVGPSAELFDMGGAVRIGIEYGLGGAIEPLLGAGFSYAFAPVKAETAVSILGAEAGGGVGVWLNPRFALRASALAGYYFGFLHGGGVASGQFTAHAGAGIQYVVSPELNLSLNAAYRYSLGLYQGFELGVGTSVFLSGREQRKRTIEAYEKTRAPQLLEAAKTPEKGRGIELANVQLYEVYPVFHKFYDDHPVGVVTLINKEKTAVTDIKLTFLVKQFMDSPKECPAPKELAAEARQDVDIMSLLTDRVLEVTEATKVAADVTLEYRIEGELYRDARTFTIRILDRNAMRWDDDRRAAAFVTAKDPAVLGFAKGVVGITRGKGPAALSANLSAAMAIFSTLDLYGMSYVVDPKTPFSDASRSTTSIDFLQFPRQTLEYKAGDCDDLSILYAALLESVGIPTAFITIPGHIYLAFSTGLTAKEAQRSFASMTELVVKDDVAWVPVEVTERRGGFMKAWTEGARQWREAQMDGSAGFYPVQTAWLEYEPVGLPGGSEVPLPGNDAVLSAFLQEVVKFVDREIAPRVAKLEQDIRQTGGTPAAHNKLGILYAQYGRLDEAEKAFRAAVGQQDYVPGLLNLGNVYSLRGESARALEQYQLAARREPQNPAVLLALARIYHQAGQFDLARAKHRELSAVDRQLAERFAYLEGTGDATPERTSDAESLRRQVVWAE